MKKINLKLYQVERTFHGVCDESVPPLPGVRPGGGAEVRPAAVESLPRRDERAPDLVLVAVQPVSTSKDNNKLITLCGTVAPVAGMGILLLVLCLTVSYLAAISWYWRKGAFLNLKTVPVKSNVSNLIL